MPHIENLRKQAKQIVRWHRQRYFPVAPIIRAHLPRFASNSDGEIMAAEFRLADARIIVARKHGFDTWDALAEECQKMTNSIKDPTSGVLLASEPQLFVSDMPACLDYYQKLGFEIVFAYGEPVFYCQVRREGACLNLRWVQAPVFDQLLRESEALLSASIVTDDAKLLYLQFMEAGIEFHEPLQRQPWGASTFIVKDPAGNLVLFAS